MPPQTQLACPALTHPFRQPSSLTQAPSPTLSYILPTPTPSSPPIFEAQLRSTIILTEALYAISHCRPTQATPHHRLYVCLFMLLLSLLWGYSKDPKFFEVLFLIGDF